jgi:hypothetical protein
MNKYVYTDYKNHKGGKIIFETYQSNISEADKAFQQATNIDFIKANYIGCQIFFGSFEAPKPN